MRIKIITLPVVLALVVVWLAGFLLMPVEDEARMYIPPSQFFLHSPFSAKYWYYKHRSDRDFLIIGNSRADAALLPDVMEDEISRKVGAHRGVSSLACGGGYFPFYHEILTVLLDEKELPENVILSVSPRDFNVHEERKYSVADFLRNSSGYDLASVPYAEPFHTVEAQLADASALLFPGFFYREKLKEKYLRNPNSLPNREIISGLPMVNAVLSQWSREAEAMVPVRNQDQDAVTLKERFRYYISRFRTLRGWKPDEMGIVGSKGENTAKVDYSQFAVRNAEALAMRAAIFNPDQRGSPYPNCRFEKDYEQWVDIWDDPSGAPAQTLTFLAAHNINVYVVILPAHMLEGWENNMHYNRKLQMHLSALKDAYPNIRQIIDINNNFDHDFLSAELYYDAEHATPEAARMLTKILVNRIVEVM